MKKRSKAFTLVELLVVIAILAVLATVSIVGYSSFTKKAKISDDNSLIAQLDHFVLAASQVEDINTVTDARNALAEDGFTLENLKTYTDNYHYAYDVTTKKFALLDDQYNIISGYQPTKEENLFAFVTSDDEIGIANERGFSTYLQEGEYGTSITTNKGIDTGENQNITSVKYSSDTAQDVVIYMSSGDLIIDDTNSASHQKFYGYANLATVSTGNSCFEVYGYITELKLEKGITIIQNGGVVTNVDDFDGELCSVVNNGTVAKLKGNNTIKGNPISSKIEISTVNELEAFRNSVNSGVDYEGLTVELTSDIRLNDGWVPIGDASHNFAGTFDGKNHTISNLNFKGINLGGEKPYGFFGDIAEGGGIKNLSFSDSKVTLSECDNDIYFGFLVGRVTGARNIENITVEQSCSITSNKKIAVGGIVGRWNEGSKSDTCKIKDCLNSAKIEINTSGAIKASGIIGFANVQNKVSIIIDGCQNYGNINVSSTDSNVYVAGIYCYNKWEVKPILGSKVPVEEYIVLYKNPETGDASTDTCHYYYKNNCINSGNLTSNKDYGKNPLITYMSNNETKTGDNLVFKYMVAYAYKPEDPSYIWDHYSFMPTNELPN